MRFTLFPKIILFLVFSPFVLQSQNYWQQEVNYTIYVRLDDENHYLHASEAFEYINHSPDTLNELYIHLWPNAYRDKNTALAKQLYENGNDELYYGELKNRGWIDSLNFKIDGKAVSYSFHEGHSDIAVIPLEQALMPGASIRVSTPFRVKLPSGRISRLGHIKQSYQITQWYPKPAVYDKNGWNPMPYLNQGEFYSEFGSFDVSITLPSNYVVGATGDLQTDSELQFLNELSDQTKKEITKYTKQKYPKKTPFPKSSEKMKTIRYVQQDVHDFAWFADKRYLVLKGEVELPNTRKLVTTWAMFVPQNANLWQYAIEYLNDGTYYYSKWNGNYPYEQVTAVDGTISAGGGMEYPNVTVIGNSSSEVDLEIVIVHEVGHNWFYGILGSNERVHGWMDEGINTLNEVRYMQTKYPGNTMLSDMVLNGRFHMNDLNYHDLGDFMYRVIQKSGYDQPIETHSEEFSPANYGIVMYQKTGLVFHYLKDYLGDQEFDRIMHLYFDQWKFKHPQPEDLEALFEKETGKDLSWFFTDLIQTTAHVDYKIQSVKATDSKGTAVKVKNVGQVNGPVEINVVDGEGNVLESAWIEPGKDETIVETDRNSIAKIIIDEGKDIPELSRQNNTWRSKGLFKKWEPLKLEFLIGDHEAGRTNMFWTPLVSGNVYDGFMLGAGFHNLGVPFQRFQYLLAPQFGFKSKSLTGIAEGQYVVLPKKCIKQMKIGTSVKSFSHGVTWQSRFVGVSPYVKMIFGDRSKSNKVYSYAEFKGIWRGDFTQDMSLWESGIGLKSKYVFRKTIDRISYFVSPTISYYEKGFDNPLGTDMFLRAELNSSFSFRYLNRKMKRGINIAAYFGKNVSTRLNSFDSNHQSLSMGGVIGSRDLFLEQYFFDRNGSQQQMDGMGNFYTTSSLGTNRNWIGSLNLYMGLPVKPNIFGAFFNQGLFPVAGSVEYMSNAGLAMKIGDIAGVYFPLYQSENMGELFNSYFDKIRFSLQFNIVESGINLGSAMN